MRGKEGGGNPRLRLLEVPRGRAAGFGCFCAQTLTLDPKPLSPKPYTLNHSRKSSHTTASHSLSLWLSPLRSLLSPSSLSARSSHFLLSLFSFLSRKLPPEGAFRWGVWGVGLVKKRWLRLAIPPGRRVPRLLPTRPQSGAFFRCSERSNFGAFLTRNGTGAMPLMLAG